MSNSTLCIFDITVYDHNLPGLNKAVPGAGQKSISFRSCSKTLATFQAEARQAAEDLHRVRRRPAGDRKVVELGKSGKRNVSGSRTHDPLSLDTFSGNSFFSIHAY